MIRHAGASSIDFALAMWRRRKWLAVPVFTVVLVGTVAAARSLPDIYSSTTTVLVQHQQVPERFVESSAPGELETRIRTINQEILSRSRLHELIVRFGLYPELGPEASPEAIVRRMRRDIRLDFTEVRESIDRSRTIAFAISYRGRDPETVAQVTNALAALYVQRNARIRERQTTGTIEFLRAQIAEVKRNLERQEQQISAFKGRHVGELPEQQAANLSALERLNSQLRMNIDTQLRMMERRDELAARLAESPDPVVASDDLSVRLATVRQELAALRARLTEEHPDVVRKKSEIADLEAQRAAAASTAGHTAPGASLERELKAAMTQADAQLAALKSEERALRRVIAGYEQRIASAPRRDHELQQISRDYEATQKTYQSLLQRYEDAQLTESLEQRQQGEQFRILDPAVPSRSPVAPNRSRLTLMGLMISAAAAIGVAAFAEARDISFHTVDDLRAYTSVPVLVAIPPIVTRSDTRRRRLRFWLAAVGAATVVLAVAGASSYFSGGNEALVRLLRPGGF